MHPSCTVQLRNTLRRIGITERTLFYEQAGSLVYFLANHTETDKHAALIAYLQLVYAGKAPKTGWQSLGFDDAAGLQAEFEAFLKGL